MPRPWFPAEAVMTAPPGSSRREASTAASAPRTLNEPVGWRLSIFTRTGRPRSDRVIVGVAMRWSATTRRAASICSTLGGKTWRIIVDILLCSIYRFSAVR